MPSVRLAPAFVTLSLALSALAQTGPLPDFALAHAPYIYLQSGETYWPSDVTTHLSHVVPQINGTNQADSVTLNDLKNYPGNMFLTSTADDVWQHDQPTDDWLTSGYGKPTEDGTSAAPATIIAVPKDGGVVDVFYFLFYSYDLGNTAVGIRFGNHIGDWEHQMVRFDSSGVPSHVYLSAHAAGEAYTFSALPQAPNTQRPVTYVAKGTHANYATSGRQAYPVPVIGPIADNTDAGVFWDVTKNYRGYWYDVATQTFTAAGGAGKGGEEIAGEDAAWLRFEGHWGNDQPKFDILQNEQYCIGSECHFVGGPTGPFFKNIGRKSVCEHEDKECEVNDSARSMRVASDVDAQLATIARQLAEAQQRGMLRNITREA